MPDATPWEARSVDCFVLLLTRDGSHGLDLSMLTHIFLADQVGCVCRGGTPAHLESTRATPNLLDSGSPDSGIFWAMFSACASAEPPENARRINIFYLLSFCHTFIGAGGAAQPAKPAKPASTMATAPALPFSQEPIQDMG